MNAGQKFVLGAAGVSVLGVVGALAYALGQRSGLPPAPPVTAAAQTAPPAPPAAPAAPEPPPDTPALRLARQIAGASGEALVGTLWWFDERADKEVTYAMLERNAERHRDRPVVWSGKVVQIQDIPGGGSLIRLGTGSYDAKVFAVVTLLPAPDAIVSGRRVRVYGYLAGTYSYESQAGWRISIPRIDGIAVVPNDVPRRPPR